jgi:GNAT superfamily N-acetyltransferase
MRCTNDMAKSLSQGKRQTGDVTTAPLTLDRWKDLVVVFGSGRGVCSQCWCMYWRLPRREFEASLRTGNRRLFHARVAAGPPPGLIAYADGEPAGWVQIGPRSDVPNWNGPRRLSAPTPEAPADDPRVWAISCFATKAGWRGQGIHTALLAAAVDWARENGARIVDACPVEVDEKRQPISLYHGVASTFRRAGFKEVARRRDDRPLMRLKIS